MTSSQVEVALAKKHYNDFFITECKNGPTWFGGHLRMDAVAIKKSWANPCITVYEVKVSHSDFVNDSKWPQYLQYCHRFYFACPEGLIAKKELPDGAGLVYVKPDGSVRTVKAPPCRAIEPDAEFFRYILFSRLDSDRLPFYSDRKEYLKDWIADKNDGRRLGREVGGRMAQEIERLQDKLHELRHANDLKENYDALIAVLKKHGIETWYGRAEALDKALSRTYPEELDDISDRLQSALVKIEELKTGTDS
jgi:hypothetical protein